jgi:hypothetical protein
MQMSSINFASVASLPQNAIQFTLQQFTLTVINNLIELIEYRRRLNCREAGVNSPTWPSRVRSGRRL